MTYIPKCYTCQLTEYVTVTYTDIKTAIVVGGMAQQKQRRMLKRRPEIIIATPGRLWDLIKEKHPHLLNLRQLR